VSYPPIADPAAAPAKKKTIKYDSEKVKEKAKALIKECMDDARNDLTRLDRDRQDWLNLLYYRGGVDNQWVVWDKASSAWVPRPTENDDAALPSWVPRAVTNLYAKKIDGITSILDQANAAQEWAPSTDDDKDLATAKVCDAAVPVLLDECGYEVLRRQMNKHVALIDKCALCVYYDTDEKYGMGSIQALQCPSCGWTGGPVEVDESGDQCPECGAPGETLQPMLDGMGAPLGIEYPKGKMRAELIPSFEFSLPRSARISDEQRVPWILMHTRYSYEEAIREWPQAKKSIERKTKTSSSNLVSNTQRQYADAMSRLSSPRSARASGALSGDVTGPVVFRLQHDPIEDDDYQFPEGLYAVMIDDDIVECGPLMVKDDEGRFVKSILIRTYAQAPGSPFNKPPADDLVPLQYWRNLIESLLALTLLHEAAPRTFIPTTVTLEDEITGIPGQQIRFRSHIPGERPFTEPGVGANQSLFEYLSLIDQKFEELSSLNAVLMGNRPHGDPTLGETQILQERGMAAFKTPLDNLVEFEKRLSRLVLWVARQSAWAPRFRKVMGETGQWELEQFSSADLGGKVDVIVDPASAWPKSPLMTNLKLKEAVGMGVIMPQMDPELSTKILSMMDLTDLKPSLDESREQIARHLGVWKRAHTPQELQHEYLQPKPWWDLQLHVHLKSQFLNTYPVEALSEQNPPMYQWMASHVQMLQQMLSQQQMQAAAMQGKGPASKPPPAPKEEPKKPDGSALESAVSSGALQPAGAAPKANPLQEAISSGALQPAGAQPPPPPAGPSFDDLINSGILTPSIGQQE
jgi:hypothetical protein